jgi:hypothetical protein
MTQFAEGSLVYDTGLEKSGKVIRSGPQQSEVLFDDCVRIIPNQYLRALSGRSNNRP